jgi:type 1 glutamine amidotransferase
MVKVAVITGGHHYNVVAFHHLFRELEGIDAYIQHMGDFVASRPEYRNSYDVLVFFTHLKREITDLGVPPGQTDTVQSVIEALGTTRQGIILLHHSLLAFPEWQAWDDIVGIQKRKLTRYDHHTTYDAHIADTQHPITRGFTDWTSTDETYLMPDAAGDNHVLLTTQHPHSMKTLAWVRQHKLSRVFCLQMGDSESAWQHPAFRQLLTQAIVWCSERP